MDIHKTSTLPPESLLIIGLDVEADSSHELYDERAYNEVNQDLVQNIMFSGVIIPVSVREIDGAVFVVDGRQRVMAAREANRKFTEMGLKERITVPVTIHGNVGADKSTIAARVVSANNFRTEDDIIKKIRKAHRLFALNSDMEQTAVICGVSVATLNNWFKLAQADEMVHNAVREDKITLSGAYYLCTHFKAEHQRAILMALLKKAGNIRISDTLVKNYHKELIGASTYDPDVGILNAEDDEMEMDKHENENSGGSGGGGDGFAPGFDPDSDEPYDNDDIVKTSAGKTRTQAGVTKTWLRKALASDAAKNLDDDQRGVLYWIANGFNEDSSINGWWNKFNIMVAEELRNRKAKKKAKKEEE